MAIAGVCMLIFAQAAVKLEGSGGERLFLALRKKVDCWSLCKAPNSKVLKHQATKNG